MAPDFPGNAALFKSVNALLVGVVAWQTWRFARVRLDMSAPAAAFTALAGTATIPMLVLSSAVMSEVFFLALLLPWLLFAERAVDARDGGMGRAAVVAATGLLLFYVRAHAIVILPALSVAYLLRGARREALVTTIVGLLVVLPWFAWVGMHESSLPGPLRGAYGSYGAWLVQGLKAHGPALILAAIRENVATLGAIVGRSFGLTQHQPLQVLAVVAVLALCVAGVRVLYTRARVTLLFTACYVAALLVWPFSPLRFIWGVWPLLMLLLVAGVVPIDTPRRRTPFRVALGVAGVTALAGMLAFNVRGYANAWWTTVSRSVTPRIQPQLEWVAEHTDSADVIAADDEGAVYLYTGRRAVPANVFTADQYFAARPATVDAANLAAVMRAFAPRYVVAWANPTIASAELLAGRRPHMLARIDTIAGGRVYERR